MIIPDLLNYLQAESIGVKGTTLFGSELPLDKNGVISLLYSPSPEPNKSIPYYSQTIDFWARYSDFEEGMEKMNDIMDLLHKKANWETANYHIYLSYANGMVDDLDRDSERRHILKLTFTFTYRAKS